MSEHKGESLKAGQDVSCVQYVPYVDMHRLNSKLADGNGVPAMSRGKLTKSYTTVKPRSRATKCASSFVHILGIVLIPAAAVSVG